LPCEVRDGGLRDAILHSVESDATHGLRRSNDDKRRAVSILLQDELVSVNPSTGKPWSDREFARRCAVDHKFVAKQRTPLTEDIPDQDNVRTYRDRHGNVIQTDTARIGPKPAELVLEQVFRSTPSWRAQA
jgi:hypothetical protein